MPSSLPSPTVKRALVVAMLVAAALAQQVLAQQVRVLPPVGAIGGRQAPATASGDDPGQPVEMFENPNLDRYLRKAHDFLDRADYTAAIQVLQDVIEGRTVEVVAAAAPESTEAPGVAPGVGAAPTPMPAPPSTVPSAAPTGPARPPAPREPGRVLPGTRVPGVADAPPPALDARNSVFSEDGRIYRPIRRLCHELLARMPSIGIEIYRTTYEVAADELLQAAVSEGAVGALEQVANRYFVTLPAGRAMALLADRLMHEGRYRAAVQVLRDLVEVYPADNRRRLGISDVWCRFKIALCLRLAGEVDAAHAAVEALATSHREESLRLLGELQAVKDLPASSLFARDVALVAAAKTAGGPSCLGAAVDELVGLWQYRFRNPTPYKDPKPTNNDGNPFFEQGVTPATMPFASRYGPASWVAFHGDALGRGGLPRASFFEHFRLRTADATAGLQLAQSDGNEDPPVARENHPRVRIAASDYALLRPVEDEARRYAVLGHARGTTSSLEALRASELVAFAHDTLQRLWSSTQWLDGEGGLRDVTFLAAPVVFGERLLLPSLRRGAYALECIDRSTGRPLWHTPLHAGGSPFYKAPGCPVAVHGGTAYVATNAGCVAAVDAFAGDLRWIRRYERVDARRAGRVRRPSRNDGMGAYRAQFAEADLPGFLPNDLLVLRGLVMVAPCDGDLLLCLDGATGQPLWWVDGSSRYAPYGRLRTLVGLIDDELFATSDTHLVAIGATGGLVKWARELPAWNGPKTTVRGRGAIAGDWIALPGEREVLLFRRDGRDQRRLPLPPFDESREPLAGSQNLVVHGPWLALGYQGGVEVFSSRDALANLAATATDPLQKAGFLVLAGDADAATAVITAALRAADPAAPGRRALMRELLVLTRERAQHISRGSGLDGGLERALAHLDAIAELLTDRPVRLDWHLARVEICKEAGDLRAHEREQVRLYDYMEGKG